MTAEERAYLWLCGCTSLGDRDRAALLRAADPAEILLHAETIFPAVLSGEHEIPPYDRRMRDADAFLKMLAAKHYFALTPFSEDYPEPLRHISLPPLVLYGLGRRELIRGRKFCVVGSRTIPPWAEKAGRDIAERLAEKFVIVTGLAEGGDSAAIAGALGSGNLISVLPCGLDCCYPAAHASLKEKIAERGLLISELPPWEEAKKYSFHARNRLLAGLSEGVFVLAAATKSGALITANCALEYGRDVFAFPYSPNVRQGEGCNELIKCGAYLVTGAEDIFSVYGIEAGEKKEIALSGEEREVLAFLKESGQAHPAAIAERTGKKIFEVTAILSALEIKGAAVKAGGNQYSAAE